MPLTHYAVYDTVTADALEKDDIFSYAGQVYEVASPIDDDGNQIAVPVYDEMDDPDILFLDAYTSVDLLRYDY